MHSRYLQGNPVPLLEEKGGPAVRYLLKRDLGAGGGAGYEDLSRDPVVVALLQREEKGILGDEKRFDIYYRGTQWCLAEAVEYGLDARTEPVAATARFVAEKTSTPEGGFIFNWTPALPVACRTGDMVRVLGQVLGNEHENVRKGVDWICRHQRHDGGWLHCPLAGTVDMMKLALLRRSGKGLGRENDPSVSSCFYATAACLQALLTAGKDNRDVIARGRDFFLARRLYLGRGGKPVVPRNAWNHDFRLLGYPLMCQYDILTGLHCMARCGVKGDERISAAFNILMKKQNSDGTWNLEQTATGMLYGPEEGARRNRFNAMVTLRVLRFLRDMGE